MSSVPSERPSGLRTPVELPWGSDFGLFYASERELLQVVVPFVAAGLQAGELCSWEVSPPLSVERATRALADAVPEFSRYTALGQVEIVPVPRHEDGSPRAQDAIERRLDAAMLAGFDGLRLVCPADPGARAASGQAVADAVRRLNVVAAILYPRASLGALDLMQVVQDHRFALICNSGRWEVLEGSEARSVRDALKRSEEKLQSLFRNMSEGFAYHRIVLDARGTPCDYVFLEVNPAFERLTGLVAREVVGRRVTQVLPGIESDPTDWIGTYGRVALTGEPVQFESHATPLDRWYSVSAFAPHRGFFAVTFTDITDRKRAEAERRAAEERLLVTLRSIGDAVVATDTRGRVTLMNGVAEELTGWSESEARGRRLDEVFRIVDELTGAAVPDPVRAVTEQGSVVALADRTVLIARDGRRIAIADSAAPVRSGHALLGVVLVFRDVTAVRQAEQERELTIEFLRLVNANARTAELSDAAIGYFRQRSGCQAVALRLKGDEDDGHCDGCELAGGCLLGDEGDATDLQGICGRVIGGRVDAAQPFFTEEGSFWTNDAAGLLATAPERGGARECGAAEAYASMAAVPLRAGGERLGVLQLADPRKGMFEPAAITRWERLTGHLGVALAQARAEDELSRANERLSALARELQAANTALVDSDRRKNEFLAMLSHELRNPLAPIRNSLYVLERSAPGGNQSLRAQEVIGRQVGHLTHLVDDLLDVTRVSRNKIHLQRRRVDLCDVVRRSLEDQRSLFERAGVELEADIPAEPLSVNADVTRVAQVIGNLLQNAAKFTGRGGRTRVRVVADRPARQAVVRVADSGVGMAPETLASLFQPFVQADKTLDRSNGGLGLGLALVKGLVELHGGAVAARSEGLGKGAEFTVTLPLDGSTETRARSAGHAPPRRRRRVLVVEDTVDAADSLRDVLELAGHEVSVAYNGADGLAIARELRPEVVLCDIGLPGMSGYDVARAFRADAALRETRLVALSGYALPEDVQRAREAGFDEHMAKPPNLPALEQMLAAPAVRTRRAAD